MADTVEWRDPGLRAELEQFKKKLGPEALWTLKDRYKFGRFVLRAYKREAKGSNSLYGAGIMDKFARALGLKRSVLDKVKRFAEAFNKEQLKDLTDAQLPDGAPLSWSHVRSLLTVTDPKKRAELIEQTAAKGWTSARLRAAIRALKGAKAHGGGPRPLAPADLHELVLQMNHVLDAWENRHDQVWAKDKTSLTGLVERLPKPQQNEKVLGTLLALKERWKRAGTRSQQMVKEVDQVIAQLQENAGKG